MQDVKINKEIRDYKEKIVFGLFDVRQTICIAIGIVLAVITYNLLPGPMSTIKLLICIIPVIPCGIIGFFTYNKMTGDELLLCMLDYYIRKPKRYPSVPENKIYDEKVQKYLENVRKLEIEGVPEPKQEKAKGKTKNTKAEKPAKKGKVKNVKDTSKHKASR